ncbi:MAG: hypothetical protein A3G18_03020 [Rhodospirillales bacterium RIFCSPLOWO2_12_FULL_58_28]|nr:MAG: hypothetical protein A3H92_13460 [Rhodospirillales bacterium RIFCSPLOWO2_02_FULL_58_16]OHC77169.1 MAG: hypothetical protein A3G18_03020 [Rhodospirillales bacterium RIFCSPLOWO2_12_FULL_58_28]
MIKGLGIIEGIIDKFGGMSAMSRAMGHKHPTTIQGWKDSGSIPYWRRGSVMAAVEEEGIILSSGEREYLGRSGEQHSVKKGRREIKGPKTKSVPKAAVKSAAGLSGGEGWALHLIDKSLDLVCLCKNGLISYINESGARHLGFKSPEKAISQPFVNFVHAEYVEVANELLTGGIVENDALPLKLSPGKGAGKAGGIDSEVLFLPFGEVGSGTVIVQAHNITERLRSATAILASETRYRNLIEQSLDMICICDGGVVTYINAAGAEILGAEDPSQLIGCALGKLVHPDYSGIISEGLGNFTDEGMLPLKFVRLDHKIIDVETAVMSFGRAGENSFMIEARDITERKRAAEELRKAHDELELRVKERTRELTEEISERRNAEKKLHLAAKVIANLNEAVVIVDTDFLVTSINPAFGLITGFSPDDVVGKQPPFYLTVKANPDLYSAMRSTLKRKGSWEEEFWCKHKNGTDYAVRLSISAIVGENGKVQQYAAVINDITKRKQDEERIHYQANFDALTGLPNRALFHDRLNQVLPTMKRLKKQLGLMFIDLDGFKLVNDTLGHNCGDLLLQEASRRLTECIRGGDTVARLGGDEFTVIMPNLTDPQQAPLLGQRILDALCRSFDLDGHETFISGSIGITIFPDDAVEAVDLIKNADAAMYRAKEQGKANYQFFTSDLNDDVKERMVLKNGLGKALERDEFILFYQPKLNILTGEVTSCEALMRWINKDMGGMVSPVKFIPILEETGHVVEVGEWALRTACNQHVAWLKEGLPPIRIAVNLSARQLRESSFVRIVEDVLKETGVGADGLEIEITESMLMSDSAKAVIALDQLHDMGIQVAMDDFGTGYSSLSYLKRFPIDTIKIDRSFVSDITTSHDDAEIIRTIITMGQTLGRKIVAEGVEIKEQLEMLRNYRCDEIQGYFFSRPMPANEMLKFFNDKGLMPV